MCITPPRVARTTPRRASAFAHVVRNHSATWQLIVAVGALAVLLISGAFGQTTPAQAATHIPLGSGHTLKRPTFIGTPWRAKAATLRPSVSGVTTNSCLDGYAYPQYGTYTHTDPGGYITLHVQYYWCPRWWNDTRGVNFAEGWVTATRSHAQAEIWISTGASLGFGTFLFRGSDARGWDGTVIGDGSEASYAFLVGSSGMTVATDDSLPADGTYAYLAWYSVGYSIRDDNAGYYVSYQPLTVATAHYV